jgi:hypothetical protein
MKFLGFIALVAVIGFTFAACGDNGDDDSAKDSVRILSVTPIRVSDITFGTEQEFLVKVRYNLVSHSGGVILVSSNFVRITNFPSGGWGPEVYRRVSGASIRVEKKGSGEYEFKAKWVPLDWRSGMPNGENFPNGKFTVSVNLYNGDDHLANDTKNFEF